MKNKKYSEQEKIKEELRRQQHEYTILKDFSMTLSSIMSDENFEEFVAKKLKEISGATVVAFSEYNEEKKT